MGLGVLDYCEMVCVCVLRIRVALRHWDVSRPFKCLRCSHVETCQTCTRAERV